jgi:hypothetical protein
VTNTIAEIDAKLIRASDRYSQAASSRDTSGLLVAAEDLDRLLDQRQQLIRDVNMPRVP